MRSKERISSDNRLPPTRHTPGRNGRHRHAASIPTDGPFVNSGYSLADSERYGYELCIPFPCLLVGLGTTGTAVIHECIRFVGDAVGTVPSVCRYVTIDAAPIHDGSHQLHHIAIGTDGAGTNPHNGFRLFREHYDRIRHAIQQQVDQLCVGVPGAIRPLKTAREVTGFLVVAGSGGTSGGILDLTISVLHDCAQRRSIDDPRVEVLLLGPGMPLRDSSRQPLPEQITLIHNTYAENLRRIYGLIETLRRTPLSRPKNAFY